MKRFEDYYKENLLETKRKIKASVKSDNLIVSATGSIEITGKAANTLAKGLRDWYEFYCPEHSRAVEDHRKFAESVLGKDKKQLLREIGIVAEQSMGADLKEEDIAPIKDLAKAVADLFRLNERHTEYLEGLMNKTCPNVTAVAGAATGAKLLSLAGSLERLALLPASTIQLLGAERALFRHLRNKRIRPPKYGVLHEHPLISSAKKKMHGKIARALADKISIAARVDYFKGNFIGQRLRAELEEKFK